MAHDPFTAPAPGRDANEVRCRAAYHRALAGAVTCDRRLLLHRRRDRSWWSASYRRRGDVDPDAPERAFHNAAAAGRSRLSRSITDPV